MPLRGAVFLAGTTSRTNSLPSDFQETEGVASSCGQKQVNYVETANRNGLDPVRKSCFVLPPNRDQTLPYKDSLK